jgi:maleylpyruvate isomerase
LSGNAKGAAHVILHGYYRSSAAYRVRIVLNLKQIKVEHVAHHLRKGEQLAPDYLRLNPQGLVPTLVTDDGTVLTQSLAIIEWLNELHPLPPLLPDGALERARVRAFAYAIACDIHPVQNLRVLLRLKGEGLGEDDVNAWAREVTEQGLDACEQMTSGATPFCFGTAPSLADICLIPQLANARRYGSDVARWPRLMAIDANAREIAAFADAAPERQPDAE